jgi:hypothetical protein
MKSVEMMITDNMLARLQMLQRPPENAKNTGWGVVSGSKNGWNKTN